MYFTLSLTVSSLTVFGSLSSLTLDSLSSLLLPSLSSLMFPLFGFSFSLGSLFSLTARLSDAFFSIAGDLVDGVLRSSMSLQSK